MTLDIARSAGSMLEEMGYEVDILPAVVPPSYRAHLFISIHADGSGDPNASGYRVAAPSRDATGRAAQVVDLLQESYGEATGLRRLPTVTRRMQFVSWSERMACNHGLSLTKPVHSHLLRPTCTALLMELHVVS